MPRLYLIRRNLESFAGPMAAEDLKRAYKKMEFGLQDEVCGHAGPWIQLDDLPRIKKYYPEVARVVRDDMLQGWGMSDHTMRGETAKLKASKSRRSLGFALVFLIVALVAFGAALYLSNEKRLSGKVATTGGPQISEANLYVQARDWDGLSSYITAHIDQVSATVSESRKDAADWLPFLRVYAYNHEGSFDPLTPKQLRGGGLATYAPTDCSLQAWHKWWSASYRGWGQILSGKKFPRKHWARILAWDPHWVSRRDSKGWLWPQNYQTACLIMAKRALDNLVEESKALPGAIERNYKDFGYDQIKARLDWLVAAVEGNAPESVEFDPENTDALNQLTCFETAPDMTSLASCRGLFRATEEWKKYADERYSWNVVRLLVSGHGRLPPDQMKEVSEVFNRLPANDFFTRFDYGAEKDFVRELMQNTGEIDKARSKVETDHPFVKLAH